MSINSVTAMDIDSPSGGVPLKRSSSAPMINDINTTMTTSASSSSSSKDSLMFNAYSSSNQPRTRRFSTSYSPVLGSPGVGPRLTPRISQLRQEECVEISNLREVAHERDIHSAMQMSQSWEDLTLVNDSGCKSDTELKPPKDCKMAPLHLNLSPYQPLCSSPSPTRLGFQPFNTGINAWKTLSPSPTRKPTYMTRRSLSPIAMRPSQLGPVKRKLDEDIYSSPRAKRMNCYNPNERSTLLIAHNNTSSPLTGSLSSVGTPESLSSADSPGCNFRSVDSPPPNRPMQAIGDEPMHEERNTQESSPKHDQIMTSVDQSPS